MSEEAEFPLVIKEIGINYAVNLNDGAMMGIFLEQRHVRKLIRDKFAKIKTVLNTFSYTGAFSVAALHEGAKNTMNVDLAKRSKLLTVIWYRVNDQDFEVHENRFMDIYN